MASDKRQHAHSHAHADGAHQHAHAEAGPNGEFPKHFVATGYVVQDGKTLLARHKKLRMWLPPGGHIDPHEVPDESVLREIIEETGLAVEIVGEKRSPDPDDGKVRYLHLPRHVQLENIDGKHQHIDLIYFCRPVGGKLRLAPNEHEEIRWFTLSELDSPEIAEEVRQTARLAISELSARQVPT